MAPRKKTTSRKKTGGSPRSRKGKPSARKTPAKKKDIRSAPDIPLTDEDTLPSATDAFENKGLGSPDCVPIAVKKKSSPVEIITLDNDDTIVTPESNFVEMTFTVEDPKNDEYFPPTVPSRNHSVNFASGLQKITSSLKNQKLVLEPECNETLEMTISIEDIKKEPADYESDFDCGNSGLQDSVKDWPDGKLLLEDQIKKEISDEDDDVPLSILYSAGKTYKCSEDSKIGQTGRKSGNVGLSGNRTFIDPEGSLSSGCPVVIPSIKTEKIDLSESSGIDLTESSGIVNEITTKATKRKSNSRARKRTTAVAKGIKASKQPESEKNTGINVNSQIPSTKVCNSNPTESEPNDKCDVTSEADISKSDEAASILNVKIKKELLPDHESSGKDISSAVTPAAISKSIPDKNEPKQSVNSSPDLTILSVKIKEEPLSDSEDVGEKTEISCTSNALQDLNGSQTAPKLTEAITEKGQKSNNYKASDKGCLPHGSCPIKENLPTLNSDVKDVPLEKESLVVTSASGEFGKENVKSTLNVINSSRGGEINIKQSASNDSELLGKELSSAKNNASLNLGTSMKEKGTVKEKLNPTERVAAEVISSLPAEKLQELIREIAEARNLNLKPVHEEDTIKSETDKLQVEKGSVSHIGQDTEDSAKPLSKQNCAQQATECVKIKCELSGGYSTFLQNTKAESPKTFQSSFVADSKPSSASSFNPATQHKIYSDLVVSKPSLSDDVARNSENKRITPSIDLNKHLSAEDLQNILKYASNLGSNLNTTVSSTFGDSGNNTSLKGGNNTMQCNVSNSGKNVLCEQKKDEKPLPSVTTDFLRDVMRTVEASATQGQQPKDTASSDNQNGVSSASERLVSPRNESDNKKDSASPKVSVKQEKNSGITDRSSLKFKDNCAAIKAEKSEKVDESLDVKCEAGNLEDDYSQISMECSEPSENENYHGDENCALKKRNRKRSRSRKNKRFKKSSTHNNCPKQSKEMDENLQEKESLHLPKDEDQNKNSVKDEKVPSSKSLVIPPEKNLPKPEINSVRKKLNDSIIEVIKLSGAKGQTHAAKGKGSSSRESDQSKLKRKMPSPKRKAVESSLFDVENDPDVVSSKASNKVQRFASRNEFLTKEMLPANSAKSSVKQNKHKGNKGKKNEPSNFQEGHLLVKSPEIEDMHFGDSGNKIEVLVRGGHTNNASHSLDPRLNHGNTFAGKQAKLNIEEYKEKYRSNVFGGSEFQQMDRVPVSTNNYSQPQQTVYQTNTFWTQSGSTNLQSASVEMTETLRNPIFSTFLHPVVTQPSFFVNNSPPVLPSSQAFAPNQTRFSLPMQSLLSQQNLPNMTSNAPVHPVPSTQNLMGVAQNPVQSVPPPSQNLPGLPRNVPVQPVRPMQSLPGMTQKVPPPVQNLANMAQSVPPVSPLSSTIPPLTFPPPPIRKHLNQQYPSLPNVSSPVPMDSAYSRFQGSQLNNRFPSLDTSLPMQSFAPPLPSQPPPKIDVPPPPPLPPPDFYPPPPPSPPPPDSSPAKSISLASNSPSLSPHASSPSPFEISSSKPLQSEFASSTASTKNSISANFISSPTRAAYVQEQNFSRTPTSTPEQSCSLTPLSTPEQLFSRPPSIDLTDSSTRDSVHAPKVPTPEQTNTPSARRPVSSADNNVQLHTQNSNPKFSSKSAFTFKDMTKANSSSKDLLFLILSWSVSWLPQQIQISDPPPITEKVKVVESSYGCYKDYYDTYFPLLLHEVWETIFLAWRQVKVVQYFCSVVDHKPAGRLLEIKCDTLVSSSTLANGKFPAEGYLVIIKFGLLGNNGSTKMYGYVSRHTVRPFDIHSDYSNPALKYLVPQPGEEVSVLTVTIKTAWKCDKINFSESPRIQLVHSLKPVLRQYDALLNLRISPLCKGILSPDSSLCKVISLSKTHSSKQKTPSAAAIVEEIASLIIKPHSVPQIIVIEALPGTDKINTLVKLIHHLKSLRPSEKKTRMLLCSRTNEVVDEVGCHLAMSQEELDERKRVLCVRLGKLSDIHPEMRKFSLEDLVSKEVNRVKNIERELPEREYQKAVQNYAKTEGNHRTLLKLSLQFAEKLEKQLVDDRNMLVKKQNEREIVLTKHKEFHKNYVKSAQSAVIKTSDVILSTVANCHQQEVEAICGKHSPTPLDCCIIDDASQCTEIETLLPLLYGISKLVLFGDPNITPRVLSKTASSCNYDLSYYQRVFSQVQIR